MLTIEAADFIHGFGVNRPDTESFQIKNLIDLAFSSTLFQGIILIQSLFPVHHATKIDSR